VVFLPGEGIGAEADLGPRIVPDASNCTGKSGFFGPRLGNFFGGYLATRLGSSISTMIPTVMGTAFPTMMGTQATAYLWELASGRLP
jgi:hypothetical protein